MINRTTIIALCLGLTGYAHSSEDVEHLHKDIEQVKKQYIEVKQQLDAAMSAMEKSNNPSSSHSKTHIGGYGELHYNNLDNKNPGGSDTKEIDFHRFVLMFSHEFSDTIRFVSELELEHALVEDTSDGSGPGELELEQAYIEFDLSETASGKAGVFLVPVGILNETHEPPTFYGVERNNVEKNIIPSTWWEAGAAYSTRFDSGISLDVAAHSGLNTSSTSNYAVRSGRQKSAKAAADDLAYTARIKWSGVPGLELAATLQHQSDITQSTDATAGSANLIEAHAVWQKGPFNLRALYATWDLDGSGPASVGADEQTGWYVEPSFRINEQWGVFARYNEWDNRAGDATDSEYSQVDVGLNYWPHADVVLKIDYQDQDAPTGSSEYDGINIGVGYQF